MMFSGFRLNPDGSLGFSLSQDPMHEPGQLLKDSKNTENLCPPPS